MGMQDLAGKAEEVEKMRMSMQAAAAAADKEKEIAKQLYADITQLRSDKVTFLFDDIAYEAGRYVS